MSFSVSVIKLLEDVEPSLRKVLIGILEEIERQREASVTKKEFNELKEIVRELAEAQKRTEQGINELTEAQKKTEQRLTRLEKVVEELAEAQKRTEEELRKLAGEHRKTREQVGGLAHTVGYVLEDRAYRGLPELLKRDFGIKVITPLTREYIEVSPNKYEEINIIGRGRKNGKKVLIVGECKSQLKKGDIDAFLRLMKRAEGVLDEEKILLAVTYQAPPPVRSYAKEKGIKIYFSYEMPL